MLVEAVDISAYHTYKMVYDPVTDSVDVIGGWRFSHNICTHRRACRISGFNQIQLRRLQLLRPAGPFPTGAPSSLARVGHRRGSCQATPTATARSTPRMLLLWPPIG